MLTSSVLREIIQSIIAKLPPDQTLPKESLSIALLSGDIARVLRLAAESDTWFVTHLCDLYHKLGLLADSVPVNNLSLRDWFLLSYSDLLMSDPGLWRCTVDYLANVDNVEVGRGRMRQILLSIGATASMELDDSKTKDSTDGEEILETGQRKHPSSKTSTVEDVLTICATYGLEDVARGVCLVRRLIWLITNLSELAKFSFDGKTTAETLIAQRKYGQAVAYCVRANDARRINKIADLILNEYIINGQMFLPFSDPTVCH